MTRPAETLKSIDSVNSALGVTMMAERHDPETEIAPLAWSREDGPTWCESGWGPDRAETLLYPETGSLFTAADERAYSWRTVQIFVGLVAVAVLAATWLVAVWWTHREDTAHAPPSAPTVQTSPDDRIVAAPAPPAAVPPPVVDDDAYVATAISIKTMRASYGTAVSDYQARSIAITECKSHTGDDGCMVVESTHNGCVAAVMDQAGDFSGGKGPDADSAKADANSRWNRPGQSWVTTPACSK